MNLVNIPAYQLDDQFDNSSFSASQLLEQLDITSEKSPLYNVILLDDNDHTYDYVVEMLSVIFGYTERKSFEMACEVDFRGRVVVFTSTKEIAEQKSSEILNYGPDWRLNRSKGSMSSVVEKIK